MKRKKEEEEEDDDHKSSHSNAAQNQRERRYVLFVWYLDTGLTFWQCYGCWRQVRKLACWR
jgi:hypothetical protein